MARETAAEREAREAQKQADKALQDAAASVSDVDPGEGSKVKVGDRYGDEIVFTRGVDEVARFKVTDGHVTASDPHERQLLLANIVGAEVVDG